MTSTKVNKKQSALIRNVLSQPFKQKWPLVEDEDIKELLPPLKSLISPMRIEPPKGVLWSELKDLTKDKRKELQRERQRNLTEDEKKKYDIAMELRNQIFSGINAVTRGAEKDLVDFALIAGDIEPRMLVKPLMQLLYSKEIPVLVIPELKKIASECLSYRCVALGFQKNEKFSELKSLVVQIFEKVKTSEEEQEEDEIEEPMTKTRKIDAEVDLSSIYVYKSDHKSNEEPSGIIEVKNVTNEKETLSKNARYYLPPVVNRMRSNPSKRRKKDK